MNTSTRRHFLSLLATAGAGAAVTACGSSGSSRAAAALPFSAAGDPEVKTLRYQGSIDSVTPPELAADLGYLAPITLDWVGNPISGPQDIQSAATGQTDFGGAFNGSVVKLYAAGAPITAVISEDGINKEAYSGFFVPADSPIVTARDLIGKKVGMNTLGAHSQAVLDIYLARNGLSPSEIAKVEPVVTPPVDTAESIRLKQIDVGVLSGIFLDVALAQGGSGLRMIFSDYQVLGNASTETYVLRNEFIAKNPNATRVFVTGVAKAFAWAQATPRAEVVDRLTKIITDRRRANETTAAMKYWQTFGVTRKGGAIADTDFSTWIAWLAGQGTLAKGQVTATQIYTNTYNTYAKGAS